MMSARPTVFQKFSPSSGGLVNSLSDSSMNLMSIAPAPLINKTPPPINKSRDFGSTRQ